MELRIKHKKILISVWLNGGDKNILLAGGLPQYVTKYHPLVKMAEEASINLFVPRYMGSWESGGTFSVKNCVKTVEETIRLIRNGKGEELYGNSSVSWNSEKIYLVGFSFGGFPALLNEESVTKTILVNPFVNLILQKKFKGEDIEETLRFLKRAYANMYRFDFAEVIKDLISLKYPEKKDKLVLVRGVNDKTIPKEQIDWISAKYNPIYIEIPGGHSLNFTKELFEKVSG